jgi:hypothetical protein
VDVFWKRTDAALGHQYYTGVWSGPESLGAAPLGSDPFPVSSSPGVVDVFWKGTDAALWHSFYANGAWQGPFSLGSGPLGSAPVAATQPNGVIDVFWKGTTGELFHKRYNGTWNTSDDLGGTIS